MNISFLDNLKEIWYDKNVSSELIASVNLKSIDFLSGIPLKLLNEVLDVLRYEYLGWERDVISNTLLLLMECAHKFEKIKDTEREQEEIKKFIRKCIKSELKNLDVNILEKSEKRNKNDDIEDLQVKSKIKENGLNEKSRKLLLSYLSIMPFFERISFLYLSENAMLNGDVDRSFIRNYEKDIKKLLYLSDEGIKIFAKKAQTKLSLYVRQINTDGGLDTALDYLDAFYLNF